MNPEDLAVELLALPWKIRERQAEVMRLTNEVETTRRGLAKAEAEIAALVAAERAGDKPAFPNETARKAEVARRLAEDERVQKLRRAEESLRDLLDREKLELGFLENEFSAKRHVLDYFTATKERSR